MPGIIEYLTRPEQGYNINCTYALDVYGYAIQFTIIWLALGALLLAHLTDQKNPGIWFFRLFYSGWVFLALLTWGQYAYRAFN